MSDDLSIPTPTYRMQRRSRGMDPGTRRLAMIAGALGVSLVAVLGASQLVGHRSETVPIVQADPRPIRVKPDNPGGLQIAGTNEDIFSGDDGGNSVRLAPPPEVPAPQALRAPPPPVARPVAPVAAQPIAAKPAPAAVAEKAAEKPAAAASADKKALVQLAAFGTEEQAKAEWQRLEKRMPDLFASHHPAVSKTERDGHTLWRLRTGGFADTAQAAAFCEHVRAKGAGCSVADF